MRKNKLLLLLALLMTAATGAWAQDAKHLITATYDKQTRLLEQPLPYATTIGELYEAVTGESFSDLLTTMTAVGMPLTGIGSNNTSVVSIGELNGASTPVTVNADGKATVGLNFSGYVRGSYVSVVPPLYAYMKDGVKDADKWTVKVGDGQAQALPIGGLKGDGSETVTLKYTGRLKVKGVTATSDAAPTGKTVDLSTLTADYEAQDGEVLTGTLGANVKISIADGATVTLDGVNISNGQIACSGNANIILMGANTVTAASEKAAIKIGGSGTTLTITGSGSLTAQGGLEAAGIGTDRNEDGELSFGNIVINGGTVTATGGKEGAGIGTGLADGQYASASITCGDITINGGTVTAIGGLYGAGIGTGPTMSDGGSASITCGDITINGGTVTATGGDYGPGIGTGVFLKYGSESASNRCGNITIGAGVTSVTATKGGSYSPNSIGKGYAYGGTQNYGTITIGGTVYATGVTTSPFTYDPAAPSAKPAATVTTAPTGAAIVGRLNTNSTALVSGGVADGGTLWYAVTTTNTKPTSTAGFSEAVPTAQSIKASGTVYVWYYVKGDDTHSDSEIAATAIEVPVADVVWDVTNVSDIQVRPI